MFTQSSPLTLIFFPEDPHLSGEAVYETITGIQSQGVQACVKHFIGNNQVRFPFHGYLVNSASEEAEDDEYNIRE